MFLISLFIIFLIHAAPVQKTNNLELIEMIDFAVASIEEEMKSIESQFETNNELIAKNTDEILEMNLNILEMIQSLNSLQILKIIQILQIKNEEQSWKLFCFFIECAITGLIFGGLIGFVGGIISIVFQMQGVDSRSKKWHILFGSMFLFSLVIVYCIVTYFAKLNFPHLSVM